MKIKVAIASLAVAVVVVAAFAFSKPTTTAVYNYKSSFSNQRLAFGTTSSDPLERSIDQNSYALFEAPTSWTKNPVSFDATTNMQAYLGSITFNEELTADGGSDGELTIQEALDALKADYITNHNMPQSLQVGSAMIDVVAATEAH